MPSLGAALSGRLAGNGVDVIELQTAGSTQNLGLNTRSIQSAGSSIFSGTRLGVGKQIGDRTFVSANTGLCQFGELAGGNKADWSLNSLGESVGLKIEWRLPNDFSVAAGSEPSTSALFCTTQNTAFRGFVATPRQYGFDLFKSWQF